MAGLATSWVGRPRVKGSSESMQMMLLTFSMIGLQFCWGTEMTYGAPYLLSLGLSKSRLSLVWIAGPLSGLIMQPLIGMISDTSTSKFGRRRPFMVGGTIAVMLCLLLLGWTSEVVGWFVKGDALRREFTVVVAVVDIYVLDFVINIAQSTCRALVVDTLPIERQQLGSAWASRMAGIGHLMNYGIGSLDLEAIFGKFMGDTQFKKLCLIAAIAMGLAQGTTCWAVTERVLVRDRTSKSRADNQSLVSILSQIFSKTIHLPKRIHAICMVQFWSWIGWFPFLFYGSTWVGEIYVRHEAPNGSTDALTDIGRAGSVAFIVFALISFGTSIVMPWFVRNPEEEEEKKSAFTPRPPQTFEATIRRLASSKPTLLTAWALSNIFFAASMIWAPLVKSTGFATLLIAMCGVSQAIAGWAPGTFLGIEVNRMSTTIPTSHSRKASTADADSRSATPIELGSAAVPARGGADSLHLRHSSTSSAITTASTGELSGIYLGILNIYTTIPQFIGTAISWVVFSILEPGISPELTQDATQPPKTATKDGLSGIAVCLFIGALCQMRAAWATRRLKDD